MPISGCCRSDRPSGSEDSTRPIGLAVAKCQTCPGEKSFIDPVQKNRIFVIFDPRYSKKLVKCDTVAHVQFLRSYADGRIVKPSDLSKSFKHHDVIMSSEGWSIDHSREDGTPDYQQWMGGKGKGDKKSLQEARFTDAPYLSGGNIGFYHPTSNPHGFKELRVDFVAYAYCLGSDDCEDCGKWYEGVRWEYIRTWEDQSYGRVGESRIIDKNVTTGPTIGQLEAFKRFCSVKKFVPRMTLARSLFGSL